MRIGGFVKQSFIDWPGRVAAVVFTRGCNFRCGYCHNPSLVLPKLFNQTPDVTTTEVLAYLNQRQGWIDGVVISGGEPTIHPTLPHFVFSVKELGFHVKIDTNGSNPEMLNALINANLVDYIAMDIKNSLEPEAYERVTCYQNPKVTISVRQSLEIVRESGVPYQLRTTRIPRIHTQKIIEELNAEFSNDPYTLQEYREGEGVGVING